MNNQIKTYLSSLRQKHALGIVNDHAYRPFLETLLRSLNPDLNIIDNMAHAPFGVPNLILLNGNKPLGYIDVVDFGVDLVRMVESYQRGDEQHNLAKLKSLDNFILTNFIDFHLYDSGELRQVAHLGHLEKRDIKSTTVGENDVFDVLAKFLRKDLSPIRSTIDITKRLPRSDPFNKRDNSHQPRRHGSDGDNISDVVESLISTDIDVDMGADEINWPGDEPFPEIAVTPEKPDLDLNLQDVGLFSARVRNALLRKGIITLRLLLVYSPELLQRDIKNLGTTSLVEIEQKLGQWGWKLPEMVPERPVILIRVLTTVFLKHGNNFKLDKLIIKANQSEKKISWNEDEIVQGALEHPYIDKIQDDVYRFEIEQIDTELSPINNDESSRISLSKNQTESLVNSSSSTSTLDADLFKLNMFSRRVTNALVRRGIVTLRILLLFTPELLCLNTKNLGPKGLVEIEENLQKWGAYLPKTANEKQVTLVRLLSEAFYNYPHPISLFSLTLKINQSSKTMTFSEDEVTLGAQIHPYIDVLENGYYRFELPVIDSTPNMALLSQEVDSSRTKVEKQLNVPQLPQWVTDEGVIILSELWPLWFGVLSEREQKILTLHYGINGNEPLTLKEIGQILDLTRERVRQIEIRAFARLIRLREKVQWLPFQEMVAEGIQRGNGVLTQELWDEVFTFRTLWNGSEDKPSLLQFFSAMFEDYHYLASYQVVTLSCISRDNMNALESKVNEILKQHKNEGMNEEAFVAAVQNSLGKQFPSPMYKTGFILQATELFDRIELEEDGCYHYLKKKRISARQAAHIAWTGNPDTRLQEWELKLRAQFDKIAWFGQLPITEEEFYDICLAVQEEAQAPNYVTKVAEGQPKLVPAAVFITTMVFAARYLEQEGDEFWTPYLRTVWGVEYTPAFRVRCRTRFMEVVPYLEQNYSFEFPRQSDGDMVTAIYRHALLPRYVQADFAAWLRSKWQDILAVAETPELLLVELRQDKSFGHLFHRLQKFILDKATQDTAAALITNMAAAISLHVNDGESIENISALLADTPIEQELWREIAQVFIDERENKITSSRLTKPRLTWVWSLDDEEMALRVQNIVISQDSNLEGVPDRLVWIETPEDDPLEADIEVEVSPIRMTTGEYLITDAWFPEPDGSLIGQIVLLTNMDELVIRLDIPSHPKDDAQFFRLTQQGAFGIPVQPIQVSSGNWLVCAKSPLTFLNEEDSEIEPNSKLAVPYPLDEQYQWAAEFTLSLPITVIKGSKKLLTLTNTTATPSISQPQLSGSKLVSGLSRQVQPTFADTEILIAIENGGETLLKRASLWLQGKDGWRWQRPLTDLRDKGAVKLTDNSLQINLSNILPKIPNFYTLEFRFSLQPVFSVPLQFAVVPGLKIDPVDAETLYTPANPPQVSLRGVAEETIVRHPGLVVDSSENGVHKLIWTDLRHDPLLLLRFGKVDIPLVWSIPHFMVWLEPKPTNPFLTLEELRKTTLHAVGTKSEVTNFRVFVAGQRYREFSLKQGRFSTRIEHSQLYNMVRLAPGQHKVIKAQVGSTSWLLFEVRQRPELLYAHVEYDSQEKTVIFNTGLTENWSGNGRFVAESLTNPFAPPIELGRTSHLQEIHFLPAVLADGVYIFRLELDGSWLPLQEEKVSFTVGDESDDMVQSKQLVEEIRSGQFISHPQAADFVLFWAGIAEKGSMELTASTLYQLATIPAKALEYFDYTHLQRLWAPLTEIKKVQNEPEWIDQHGCLPAWVLLSQPIKLKIDKFGYLLQVYPVQTMQKGLVGKGYGRLRLLSPDKESPKELVFVQWQPATYGKVHVEAGLLDEVLDNDWAKVDFADVYGLRICTRCGHLTGVRDFIVTEDIGNAHTHGKPTYDLPDITMPVKHGGYHLMAEVLPERRGDLLLDTYEKYEVPYSLADTYLPEPSLTGINPMTDAERRLQLVTLIREIKRHGFEDELSYWASAARLLSMWYENECVSQLGRASFALSILLRTAAYHRRHYERLLKDANLAVIDVQTLLLTLNKAAPAHVGWGLTWAELLCLHSPEM